MKSENISFLNSGVYSKAGRDLPADISVPSMKERISTQKVFIEGRLREFIYLWNQHRRGFCMEYLLMCIKILLLMLCGSGSVGI